MTQSKDETLLGLIETAGIISTKLTEDLVDAVMAFTANDDRHAGIVAILHLPEVCREIERLLEAAIILNKKI